jgi:hypothetical protein
LCATPSEVNGKSVAPFMAYNIIGDTVQCLRIV